MLLNGRPVEPEELRALALINYGHFTSMRVDDGRVRGLDLHLERLRRDCRALFAAELDTDVVRGYVRQAVGAGAAVARVTVFDPALDLGHPGRAATPHVLVTVRKASDRPLPPISLATAQYERELPQVKHVGLFATVLHRRQAQLRGRDDVLFTDPADGISEGATWNIGFVRGEEIVWPGRPCLSGVTMEIIKQLHPSSVEPVTLADAKGMSGAFVSNAAIGLRPVRVIDDFSWQAADLPLIGHLAKRYAELQGDLL